MKKHGILAFVVILSLVFVVSGCGKQDEPLNTKTGIVLEAGLEGLTIEAPDGSTYLFTVGQDTTFEGGEDNIGNTVEVTYQGEYQDKITAKTIKNVTVAPSEEPVKETDSKSATAKPSASLKYATGVVQDVTMHNIAIKKDDGKTYNIRKDDKTTVNGNITVGATVQVAHTGNFKDGIVAVSIKVTKEAPAAKASSNTSNSAPAAATTMTGTIDDVSMHNITITARDGETYSFKKDDKTTVDGDGILTVGNIVKITYTGDIAGTPAAVKIEAGSIDARE